MKHLKKFSGDIFIDGASRGNPGPSAIGVVFRDGDGAVVKTISQRIGVATNNVAEYYALIFALQEALILGVPAPKIFTDSELLARQYHGEYKIKDAGLQALFLFVSHLRGAFKDMYLFQLQCENHAAFATITVVGQQNNIEYHEIEPADALKFYQELKTFNGDFTSVFK